MENHYNFYFHIEKNHYNFYFHIDKFWDSYGNIVTERDKRQYTIKMVSEIFIKIL